MFKLLIIRRFSLVVGISLFATSAVSQYDERTEQLKGGFRKGFLLSCVPTITSQIERAGLAAHISETQKLSYCVCVGIKIFDDFTKREVDAFVDSKELPKRKKLARKGYSEQCTDSELI